MISMFIGIQYLGILILMIEILYLVYQKKTNLQMTLLIVFIATLINFVGYLFEIQATSKEMALQAVKFIYIGKPYIILGMLFFILQYYHIEVPPWLIKLLCVFHIGISMLVLTCSHHRLFYDQIDYVQDGFFPHLVLGHGPFYKFYTFCVVCYIIVLIAISVKHIRRAKTKQTRKQILCLMAIPIVSIIGLLLFLTKKTGGYDSTLPAYLICTILLLLSMVRYKILDTVELAKEDVLDEYADGLIVFDANHQVIYTNRQMNDMYPQFKQKEYGDVLAGLEQLYQNKEKLFLGDKIYELYEKEIVRDQIVYGNMLVVSDITTSYNYTIQLQQQTAIAEQANKAKTDFLAKVSHEIRTPINAVLGMDEMILRESREKEIRKYAWDIQNAANTLLGLINDILDSTKMESGKLEIVPARYELDSLLYDIVNMFAIKAKDKQLDFRVEVEEQIPNVLFGDDVRIRQILVNLLNNAMKYTPKGSVTLKVSGRMEENTVFLHYEVKDTGIGIKKQDIPRLCEAFERIEEKRNRNIEGTGLGMSIVAELLQLMDSQIRVESVYGEGSCFSFDLQQEIIKKDPIGDFEKRRSNMYEIQGEHALFTAPDANILVVDDNDINRKVFRHLLKRTFVHITEAASGTQCLELAREKKFDLIFMDCMMPDLDGVATFQTLRAVPDGCNAKTPVVILTANAVTGAKEYYLGLGFDDFLSKPVKGIVLEKMVQKYLPKELLQNAIVEKREEMKPATGFERIRKAIPRLDVEAGIQYCAGDEKLYRNILGIYVKDCVWDQIADCYEKEQWEQYRLQVHTIKSTSKVIGAMWLFEEAQRLDLAVKQGDLTYVKTHHQYFMEEYADFVERLAGCLEQEKEPEPDIRLPELEDFDWEYARRFYPDDKMLLQMLWQVADSMQEKIQDMNRAWEERNLENYQMQVHALKTSSAMVGALMLTKLARLLEMAAGDKNLERMEALHPILVEEMEKHLGQMQCIEALHTFKNT